MSHSSGRGVFDGNVKVNRLAQKTDAQQLSRNLLLAPRATVNVKPNLQVGFLCCLLLLEKLPPAQGRCRSLLVRRCGDVRMLGLFVPQLLVLFAAMVIESKNACPASMLLGLAAIAAAAALTVPLSIS